MNRRAFIFILFMILTTAYPDNALAQNWTLGDAVISEGGMYALTENGTIVKMTLTGIPELTIKIPDEIHVLNIVPAGDGVLLVGDEVLAKFSTDGDLIWAKNMSVDDATVLPNGNVAFTRGKVVGVLDSNGNVLWIGRLTLGRINESLSSGSVQLTTITYIEKIIIVAGTASFSEDPRSHIFLAAISLNGTLNWAEVLNTGYYDRPEESSPLGGYAVVAGVYGGGSDAPWIANYFVLKISSGSEIEWFNSYQCPREEDWDDFWSIKILGVSCNEKMCALGTMRETFVIDENGTPLAYLNTTGKVAEIVDGSLRVLSNGALLKINPEQNAEAGKCYMGWVPFSEMPVQVEIRPAEFSAPDVPLNVLVVQRTERSGEEHSGFKSHSEKWWNNGEYVGIALLIAVILAVTLMLAKRES
ncbi:hypothetical protein FH039_03350 [Thermococcus indicus]|uniref:PQQ-binding-like beta-propeller repeat protein n=1 Tax=Thermococcus indicus TaxID=2586643 RepID=A0A4Y5SIZ4_9EURY|nr:hypothetical protein [Thermococcus indicus]QDA30837.1 hypothetical protein FH039_03350 [Thermococcus indicus]